MEQTAKPYDLEERTFLFAQRVRAFVRLLPRTISNQEDVKQVVRSSGSVGANYIEAKDLRKNNLPNIDITCVDGSHSSTRHDRRVA